MHAGSFDLVFDVSSHETPHSCRKLITKGGYFISTAGHGKAVFGTFLYPSTHAALIRVESYRKDLEQISQWTETGQVSPVIDSVYLLQHSQAAYEHSRSGRSRGKIVIQVKA